nr:MAG TPA: hypothetical protein [Caudoviricetes sp.]
MFSICAFFATFHFVKITTLRQLVMNWFGYDLLVL